jgi:hypothetical protein
LKEADSRGIAAEYPVGKSIYLIKRNSNPDTSLISINPSLGSLANLSTKYSFILSQKAKHFRVDFLMKQRISFI